ncbi:MAG: hypothetical protein K9J27_04080 [Bacteroidales bacterium]|nr:hypothetical protein [Bacteroidales bacterium]MCF8334908.1 hypothetical protein [Bacteroidales bacterium]
MKKAGIIAILCFFIVPAHTQSIDHYLTFAPQWVYVSNKDDLMSPMTYRGHHGALRTGYKRINKQGVVNEVYGAFALGSIKSDRYPDFDSRAISTFGEITYRHLQPVTDTLSGYPVNLKIGANWHNQVYAKDNLRFTNNAFLLDINSSIGLAARLAKDFTLFERKFGATADLSFALLNFIERPSYTRSTTELEISMNENLFVALANSESFETVDDYQQIMTDLNLVYYLKNGNALRLRYGWLFAHHRNVSEMYEASHAVSFSTLFKL